MVHAPLPVVWELTRAALHCRVRLNDLDMQYNESWHDLTLFRKALATHREFSGKPLPDRCDDSAWRAAFSSFRHHGRSVTLVIEASYNHEKDGPLYSLRLQPLKLESSHRLARRFGADRFLEFIFPSPTGRDKPQGLKTDELISLLSQTDYLLLGRLWRSFYTKDDKKVEKQQLFTGTETKTLPQERLYLFAVDGNDFVASITRTIPPKEDATSMDRRTKMTVGDLLEWAISMSRNIRQPILKLFSRLALSMFPFTVFRYALGLISYPCFRPQQNDAYCRVGEASNQTSQRRPAIADWRDYERRNRSNISQASEESHRTSRF